VCAGCTPAPPNVTERGGATAPLAEVAAYASQFKRVTGGQGSYMLEFSHYDVVPPMVQQQIVAAHKPKEEEEE
jgi:elongation factor G